MKMLEVRAITRFGSVINGDDKSRSTLASANTAGCLDVFRSRLRLADDSHQSEARNIKAHLNHIGGNTHVDCLVHSPTVLIARIVIGVKKVLENLRDLAALNTTCKFNVTVNETSAIWCP